MERGRGWGWELGFYKGLLYHNISATFLVRGGNLYFCPLTMIYRIMFYGIFDLYVIRPRNDTPRVYKGHDRKQYRLRVRGIRHDMLALRTCNLRGLAGTRWGLVAYR